MTTHYDVCINGAGPIGSTLACLLAQQGLGVLLLERRPLVEQPDSALDGRAYALAEGVRPLLEDAGIWPLLSRMPQPIQHIDVLDDQSTLCATHTPYLLHFTPDDAPDTRPFGWMVEAHDLLAACAHRLRAHKTLTVCAPDEGTFTFSDEKADILLTSGKHCTAKLVIAADGRRSFLREQAGIPLTVIPYNKHALVAVLAHEHPHHGSALEHFLPQGPFARLPLAASTQHPHRSAVVITDRESRIRHLMEMPDQAFSHFVQARLGTDTLGNLTPIGTRWMYPLASQYAHRYTAQRMLLIGDAAHGLHPVAGQGMNTGFRDVRVLTNLLGKTFHDGQDLGAPALLMQYQRLTRPGNLAMLAGCDLMERFFSNRNPLLRRMRQIGLQVLERSPTLRRRFVREAMGLQNP